MSGSLGEFIIHNRLISTIVAGGGPGLWTIGSQHQGPYEQKLGHQQSPSLSMHNTARQCVFNIGRALVGKRDGGKGILLPGKREVSEQFYEEDGFSPRVEKRGAQTR